MKKLVFTLFLSLLSIPIFCQAPAPIEVSIPQVTAERGDTICIPVQVRNFDNITSFRFGITWTNILYDLIEIRTQNSPLPGLRPEFYPITEDPVRSNTELNFGWFDENQNALSLMPNDTIVEICLQVKEEPILEAAVYTGISFFSSENVLPSFIQEVAENLRREAQTFYYPGGIFLPSASSDLSFFPKIDYPFDCGSALFTAKVEPMGGQGPYSYSWTSGDGFTNNSDSIATTLEGHYGISIEDQNGNVAFGDFRVDFMSNPNGLQIPGGFFSNTTHPVCGISGGVIELFAEDYTPELYSINWNTGDTSLRISDLKEGIYSATITNNSSSCARELSFSMRDNDSPPIQTFTDTLSCFKDTATIGVLVSNESIDYSFQWNNNTRDTTPIIQVADAAIYTVSVSDQYCTRERLVNVFFDRNEAELPDSIQILYDTLTCDDTSATIGVIELAQNQDWVYNWSTGEDTSIIEVQELGQYQLSITNANNCTFTIDYEVEAPDFDFSANNVKEFLGCDQGSLTRLGVMPDDLSQVYTYEWSNGDSTNIIEVGSGSQFYQLTVTIGEGDFCKVVNNFQSVDANLNTRINNWGCQIQGNCFLGSEIVVEVPNAAAPITYSWSGGDSLTLADPSPIRFLVDLRRGQDLYIKDAQGCTDTILNLQFDCELDPIFTQEGPMRQYIVCEEDSISQTTKSYLYAEIIGNVMAPPYIFNWKDGVSDTSFFRSVRELDSTNTLGIQVYDANGFSVERNLSIDPSNYACGEQDSPVIWAEDIIVAPGEAFVYPIYAANHEGLERAVYTIDWDACLVSPDSILIYRPDIDTVFVFTDHIDGGTYETGFFEAGGSAKNDTTILTEIYFTAAPNQEGISPFLFSINERSTGPNGNTILTRPIHGSITVAQEGSMVLPGDTDANGQVNHQDLLNVGLSFKENGPDRRAQLETRREFAYSWNKRTPQSGIDLKNIDANGDGKVDGADINLFDLNWDYTPQEERGLEESGDIPFYLEVDTIYAGQDQLFPIQLGDEQNRVSQAYGVAFSIAYDPALIDPNSLELKLEGSWLIRDGEALVYTRNDPENQLFHIAISRTDGQNQGAYGTIAQLGFRTSSEQITSTTFQIKDVKLIDAQENIIPTNTPASLALIQLPTSVDNFIKAEDQVSIYPVPVKDVLFVAQQGLDIQWYTISDINGRTWHNAAMNSKQISTTQLPAGIYNLLLRTDRGLLSKRFVKQ